MNRIKQFFRMETAPSILLFSTALVALALNNSALTNWYSAFLNIPFEIRLGEFELAKPLFLWVNEGLMAVFFLLIGLEVKQELLDGELSDLKKMSLPAIAAAGGIAVPAGIYAVINWNDPVNMEGWAIPTATDIAFALGVLALLGKRVRPSIKVFLLTLAILDDIAAVVIIAIFYTEALSLVSFALGGSAYAVLLILNVAKVRQLTPYFLTGIVMWVFGVRSGVHATLAGVALASVIPVEPANMSSHSPLAFTYQRLKPWVYFGVLPLFAFANAGVDFTGMELGHLVEPVPLGIMAGLFIGKQTGVFAFGWIAVKLGLARLPAGANWTVFYGLSLLCGIGFTMSLFIDSLAFEHYGTEYSQVDKLAVLLGSLASAVCGYLLLRFSLPRRE